MKHFLLLFLVLAALPAQAISYATWVASYSLTGSDALETADPDHDGMSNLMEYVLADGVPNVVGPMSIKPVFGFCMPLADGSFSLPSLTKPDGSPLGYHNCLTYKLRDGIEDVTVTPQFSQPCPASNADGSLVRWLDGQSMVRIIESTDDKLQAVSLFRADQVERGFMRLKITKGTGFVPPPVNGVARPTLRLDLGPVAPERRTVGTITTSSITDRDVIYTQTNSPSIVTDYSWLWDVGNSGYTEDQITRQSSATDILMPTAGQKNKWTYVSAGVATMRLITPARTYEATVNLTSQSSVIGKTVTSTVSTSLRRHLDDQVNTRISSFQNFLDRQMMFSGKDPGTAYTRNSNCWLSTVDLTPIAAWNSTGVFQRGPTLISPRHIIGATHWPFTTGTTVDFVKADNNTVVTRTVTATSAIAGTDIIIGVLDSDVASGIAFARVLPATWAAKLPTLSLFPVPVCSSNQGKEVFVRSLVSLGASVQCAAPTATNQIGFYRDAIGGDSGSPCFMVINDKMVILCCWLGGAGGSGPSVTNYRTEINAAMTSLGGGYSLTDADLSGFTSY